MRIRLYSLILACMCLALSACVSQQLRFLNEAGDAAAADHLSGLTNQQICRYQSQASGLSGEYSLSKQRVAREYKKRGLNEQRCDPAYDMCLSYGIAEGSPGFQNCLVETNNSLRLENEIRRQRLLNRHHTHYCHWYPCY